MCRRGAFAGRPTQARLAFGCGSHPTQARLAFGCGSHPTQARLAFGCGSHHGPTVGEISVRVIPLAAESLGVRSMATYVEVGDLGILIDPGATLAPTRWGLPPAEAEWPGARGAHDR